MVPKRKVNLELKQDEELFDVEAVNPCYGTAWMSDPAPMHGRLTL